MFGLFPEDENSACQTGQVTYNFHSSGSFDTRLGEWASAKGKSCSKTSEEYEIHSADKWYKHIPETVEKKESSCMISPFTQKN